VRGFVIGTVVTAVAFYILVTLLPDMFAYDRGIVGLIVISVIFGIINGLIGPIVKTAALPISFMTMGLVGFLINGALLLATAFVSDLVNFPLKVGDFPPDLLTADTLVAAVVGAVVLSLISTVIRLVVPD
jgi:putative membrane protein